MWRKTYRHETPELLKDQHGKRRQNNRSSQHRSAKLPRQLPLARPGVDPLHDAENVKGGEDVEGLEDDVPGGVLTEEVEVAGAEDEGVEDLGDEGDAFGGAVAVDGVDEDAF